MLRSTHVRSRLFIDLLLVVACTLALAHTAPAQTPAPDNAPTAGTVAGRVTTDGHGLAGALVALQPGEFTRESRSALKAKTDADGRYRLVNVPPGSYYLSANAPAYISADTNPNAARQGRLLNVAAGDRLEGLDFTLTRGGVITGRIADAEGKPIVEASVRLMPVNETDARNSQFNARFSPYMFPTDDRGIYRLFGLPAGRYYVYVGETPGDNYVRMNGGSTYYPRTFYGDTSEMTEAKPVEILSGAEASGVDITVGKPERNYDVTGHVVDETGRPIAGASLVCSPLNAQGRFLGGYVGSPDRTNERGEFKLKNLRPGRYAAYAAEGAAFTQEQSAFYSDTVNFEITAQDVGGLEIKLMRGATLSGTVVLEGAAANQAARARLTDLQVGANKLLTAPGLVPPVVRRVQVNADGSFLLTGLPPGQVGLFFIYPVPKGLTLMRVERGGVVQPRGLEIAAGEQVTGVRMLVVYGASVIRGQVQFPNGAPPTGQRVMVFARRKGDSDSSVNMAAQVDELGRFIIENLPAGEYELELFNNFASAPGQRRTPADRRLVNVPDSGEVQVMLVFNQSQPQ